ncbi:MAG: hypothetical protein K2H37_04070 [Lachnospiraceae bacterium]|nr:hypothetical protein [Lachnospiraceae bacterium]
MKKREVWEEKIKDVLALECDSITASRALKDRIDEKILESEKEAENMKHLSVKKLVVGVAAVCLLVSGGVAAAGHAVSLSSHHYLQNACRDFGKLPEMEQELGYAVDVVEKFSNGYRFESMSVDDVQGKDAESNVVYTFKSMMIEYGKSGEEDICLIIEKPVEMPASEETPDATRVCGDITAYYDMITNKQVPPDYVLTEEDKAGEARGDCYISVGSAKVEVHQSHTVTWDKDGIRYQLLGFDLNIGAEEMLDMAEEIIGSK